MQTARQKFREFITVWHNLILLYSTNIETHVTTFFGLVWGIFSFGRNLMGNHSKYTRLQLGKKKFIFKGRIQHIMFTEFQDGILFVKYMFSVIYDPESDDARIAGNICDEIKMQVCPLATCAWNWIWNEWRLFLPFFILCPLIAGGWLWLFV